MSNNKTVVYEGWMVRYGRRKIGKSFIHMRYFVLESQLLAYYKKKSQNNMVPIMTLHLDGNCRVEDRGLKTQQGHMVYVLSVYSKKEKQHPMTMAAFNIQEALTWKDKIQSVIDQHQESKPTLEDHFSSFETKSSIATESSDQETQSSVTEDENRAPPQDVLRRTTQVNANPPDFVYDWTKELDSNVDPQNPNNPVSSRKYWRLLQCQNGLRIFEGIIEGEFLPKSCSRAMKAVGVVEATCEEVFEVVMSMDATRWEWDCSFRDGSLVEEVDGHTAILYHRLQLDWFPINGSKGFSSGCRTESALNRGEANWGLGFVWPRDLCYVRYWRRNDDGSYVVLFRSREHQNCPPQRGFVRAHIESGGYNISPLKPHNGKARTQVQLLMQMDLKGWGVGYLPAYQQHSLLQMLNSVAGLREFFSQTDGRPPAPRIPVLVNMTTVSSPSDDSQKVPSETTPPRHHRTPSLDQMHAANRNASLMDEYSDEDEDYQFADLEEEPEIEEKRVVDEPQEQIDVSIFSGNLPRDDGDNARDCWTISDGNNFRVRSKNFCTDKSKCDAGKHLMEFVAVDWFKDTKRMDHIARRSGCAAQVASAKGYFSIVVNLQVPGSTQYSMVFYFVAKRLIQGSLMQRFVDGDDEFRNSRLKLIPSVPKGSWIVRQSVGSSACLLGKAVDCNYYRGHNYLEIDVDIGSSTVANGVLGIVIGVIRTLVIDMAFLVQGNTPEELPERLIGAVRVCHLELASAEDISTVEVENSYNYNNKDEYYY